MVQRRIRIIVGAAAVAGAAVIGTVGVANAGAFGGDDTDDPPINVEARPRAEAAALAHAGGGQVTETEEGDEEGVYEVEVTRPDRSAVEVRLDENFTVVGDEVDDDSDEIDDDDGGDEPDDDRGEVDDDD